MALRNLFRRPIRSSLSILGVAISVMLILSVGVSSVRYATLLRESRLLYGERLIVVSKGTYFAEAVPIGSSLSNTSVTAVSTLPGVEHAVPILSIVNLRGALSVNITFAVPPGQWQHVFENIHLQPDGRFPEQDNETAIGAYVSSSRSLQIGSKLNISSTISSTSLTVTGVLFASPSPIVDQAVFMTLSEGQRLFGYQGLITMIAVTPASDADQRALQAEISEVLPGVMVLNEQDRGRDAEPLLQQFEAWSNGVQIIALLLSMLFVATLSLINVFERRRELATAYAVGATRLSLLRISILENAFVGVFGGGLGVLFGLLATLYINVAFTQVPPQIVLADIVNVMPPAAAILVFGATVITASIAGGLVFLAAMKKEVAPILRYEA